MKYFVFLIFTFPLFCSNPILDGFIKPDDRRFPTLSKTMELLSKRDAKVLVETGTARGGKGNCSGDGCSTVIFSRWASEHNAELYSVDINPIALKTARHSCREFNKGNVHFIEQDSVAFLHNFDKQIDFLYLDSYDFEVTNPLPSQVHHLKEIMAAYPYLSEQCVILVDDCDLPYGGKGKFVIQFLEEKGWTIIESGYQVLIVRSE